MNSGKDKSSLQKEIRIAVVMSTYNRARLVVEAVESFLRQEPYSNAQFSCVVVDDGSTDGTTEQLVERFELHQSSESRYINSQRRLGVIRQNNMERAFSRNRGAEFAISEFDADWFLFFDSDDVLVEDSLKEFCASIRKAQFSSEYSVIYAEQVLWDGESTIHLRNQRQNVDLVRIDQIDKRILKKPISGVGATLISRAAYLAAGGYRERRDLSGSEDWNLLFRLSLFSDFYYSSHKSFFYRRHTGNTQARQFERSISTCIIECEKDLLARGLGPKRIREMRGYCLLKIAGTFNSDRQFGVAAYYLLLAFRRAPHVIWTRYFWRVALSLAYRKVKFSFGWVREYSTAS